MLDQDLIHACRQGDRDAQRLLYERTNERIYRLLARMTGDREIALDLAQDTYLKAFTAIGSFDGRASVATWLYRIAVNEALQFLRRKPLLPVTLGLTADHPASHDHRSQPELQMDMEAALGGLEPVDRAMLLLRYQEGLDYKAIAEVADVAPGTVGSRLNRARQRLRSALVSFSNGMEESADLAHPTHCEQEGAVAAPLSPKLRQVEPR